MVNIFWTCSPISCKTHDFLVSVLRSTPDHTNTGVWLRKVTKLGLHTLSYLLDFFASEGLKDLVCPLQVFPAVNPTVLEQLQQVDAVVYGIGSLYTSICPSLVLCSWFISVLILHPICSWVWAPYDHFWSDGNICGDCQAFPFNRRCDNLVLEDHFQV